MQLFSQAAESERECIFMVNLDFVTFMQCVVELMKKKQHW